MDSIQGISLTLPHHRFVIAIKIVAIIAFLHCALSLVANKTKTTLFIFRMPDAVEP